MQRAVSTHCARTSLSDECSSKGQACQGQLHVRRDAEGAAWQRLIRRPVILCSYNASVMHAGDCRQEHQQQTESSKQSQESVSHALPAGVHSAAQQVLTSAEAAARHAKSNALCS